MIDPRPTARSIDTNLLMQRVRRLITLDTSVFDDVRADRTATIPAIIVASGATILFGVGGWLWWLLQDIPEAGEVFVRSLILGSIVSMVLWGISVGITYVTLTNLFRARVDVNELVRVMGFATAPLALGALMFIPEIEFGVALTAVALFFGMTVIAVQATAADTTPGRVLASCGAGFLVWAVVLGLLVDENAYAPGIFVFDTGVEVLKSIGDLNSAFN